MADNIDILEEDDIEVGAAASDVQDDFAEIDDVIQETEIEDEDVVAEDVDEDVDGSQNEDDKKPPVSADNGTKGIDQTKAFSKRLKEETEKLERKTQERIDNFYKNAYNGVEDPDTGEKLNIKTEADYIKWDKSRKEKVYANEYGVTKDEAKEILADQEFIREQRKEIQIKQKQQQEQEKLTEKAAQDIQEFTEVHPDIKVNTLMENKAFMNYADGKLGTKPLADIYDGFIDLVGNAESAAIAKSDTKKQRSTSAGANSTKNLLSKEQESSRLEWNRNNPDCKITQKEFLELKKGI